MNYTANLESGEKLTIGNESGHTQIALSIDQNGRSDAQNSAFSGGEWTEKPKLSSIGAGYVLELSLGDHKKWVSIGTNGVQSLDKAPDLNGAKPVELSESEEKTSEPMKPMEAMKPMAPMKPMGS